MGGEKRTHRVFVAVHQEAQVRSALEGDRGAGHDDGGTAVAPHRVKRYTNIARHSLVRTRPGPMPERRPARRDNSGFGAQGNADRGGMRGPLL